MTANNEEATKEQAVNSETPANSDKEQTATQNKPTTPEKKKDIFDEILGEDKKEVKVHKVKGSKQVSSGIVHVKSTFNNTIVTVSDTSGNVIGWSSAGKMGFRGSRKNTAYAAQVVSQDACRQAMGHGLKKASITIKGPGLGRDSAVRTVQSLGIIVTGIADITPVPHNGCRPKKIRRV